MKRYFLLLLIPFISVAQDTSYTDAYHLHVPVEKAFYYVITERNKADTSAVNVKTYRMNGQIIYEENFSNLRKHEYNGKYKNWAIEGFLLKEWEYTKGKKNGKIISYYPGGKILRDDTYDMDKLIEGHVYDPEGNEKNYYPAQIMPEFPGGIAELYKYIGSSIEYPEKSRKDGVEGRVYSTFFIEKDGSINTVRIVKGLNEEMDNEVIRVIKSLPKWKPGYVEGELARVQYNLPVNFKLRSKR